MYNAYVIAGGSGFIGNALCQELIAHGQKVYILTRADRSGKNPLLRYIKWQPTVGQIDSEIIEDNVCVINLCGANVASERWSKSRKQEIIDSRTTSAQALYKLCAEKSIKASYFISASAIGYYGSPSSVCVEEMNNSDDYLGTTCKLWEDATTPIKRLDIPLCIMRIGLVMGREAGALPELMNSLNFKLAAVPCNGKQIYSWIHLHDVSKAFLFACDKKLQGTYNCVAPKPASAKQLITAMANAYGKKYITVHIPKFALEIALGEFAIELTKSAEVSSAKLQSEGFDFAFENVESCMTDLLQSNKA
jgi:uncharacterized protein